MRVLITSSETATFTNILKKRAMTISFDNHRIGNVKRCFVHFIFHTVRSLNMPCADPERFVRGSNFFSFVLVDEEREDQNSTLSGASSARQRNAI